ncbi:HEAT repeat domain-containing protein [Micromonospora sp. NPDC051196]|uniref:HEAT repeat domain-containing protein n=1 Tax=Micromonospora sp. NPDC051196 TaxID=3155281 RepID=UPI003441264E
MARFKQWQESGAPDYLNLGHGAEWEANYPHWEALLDAAEQAVKRASVLEREVISDLLFVLARDNEDERVAEILRDNPAALRRLLPQALRYPDAQARWQVAAILPALGAVAVEPLMQLKLDPDEYVRRRAAIALSEIGVE